jgi:hypothetical protein
MHERDRMKHSLSTFADKDTSILSQWYHKGRNQSHETLTVHFRKTGASGAGCDATVTYVLPSVMKL